MHAPPEVQRMFSFGESSTGRNAWLTRALQLSRAYDVPPPSRESSFRWVVMPQGGVLDLSWTVYTDGSLIDGPTSLLGRTGWSFVAVNREGVVLASAHGVPPSWITTTFGAETWAVYQAVKCARADPALRIDCKAVVDLLQAGKSSAVIPKRLTARVWADIFAILDGECPKNVSWMPAHTAASQVGVAKLGNGCALTALDRNGNDQADCLAKTDAKTDRVPEGIRRFISDQESEVDAMARWVARATLSANDATSCLGRDSESAPKKQWGEKRPKPPRAPRQQLPLLLGGHDLIRVRIRAGKGWRCLVCRRGSTDRAAFGATRCDGSAAIKWASAAAHAALREESSGRGHVRLLSGNMVWCWNCGAHAEHRAKMLTKPCRGDAAGTMRVLRDRLRHGLHPRTGVPMLPGPFPEPGASLPSGWREALLGGGNACLDVGILQVPHASFVSASERLAALRERVQRRELAAHLGDDIVMDASGPRLVRRRLCGK